jgi:hypothetical protein
MMWSWPEMPAAWIYALMTAGMILFWTLVIFGAIVLVHCLGRENRPAVGRTALPNPRSADEAMAAGSEPGGSEPLANAPTTAAAGGVIGTLVVLPLPYEAG